MNVNRCIICITIDPYLNRLSPKLLSYLTFKRFQNSKKPIPF
jgi:hypothetical protein